MALARTQYVRSGDADIAFRVTGDAPHDVVLAFDFASHLEEVAEHPQMREFVAGLERFARVLMFDMRGVGMSAGVATTPPPSSPGWTTWSRSWMPPGRGGRRSSPRATRHRWR